jgi:phosphopantetheinyl transferase
VVRLGPKFLDQHEIDFLGNDPLINTIAWSAKESIFKCQGRRGVSLKNNIRLNPFTLEDKVISGRVENTEFSDHHYQVKIEWQNDIVLTYTVW